MRCSWSWLDFTVHRLMDLQDLHEPYPRGKLWLLWHITVENHRLLYGPTFAGSRRRLDMTKAIETLRGHQVFSDSARLGSTLPAGIYAQLIRPSPRSDVLGSRSNSFISFVLEPPRFSLLVPPYLTSMTPWTIPLDLLQHPTQSL